jgi:hypothetical protein
MGWVLKENSGVDYSSNGIQLIILMYTEY